MGGAHPWDGRVDVQALASPGVHPVTAYAVDVVDGRIVAGKPVQWACQKHLDDLEAGEKRAGIWFYDGAADHIINFFAERLFLVEGEGAGKPIILEPWQQFIVGSIFGWMRDDGYRRYREAWVRVARGNFKTGLGAGIGLYCTGWDGFWGPRGWQVMQGAQTFVIATKLAQASICHKAAIKMAVQSPYVADRMIIPETPKDRVVRCRIVHPETGSFFENLGRDSETEDGWAPTCAILDEVHAYGDRGMWDVMESAFVKRAQPLLFAITTAGYGGPGTFGMKQDRYYRELVDPASGRHSDSAFVYVAELDERVRCVVCRGQAGSACPACGGRGHLGDDYRDEGVWLKANPNLGVSVYVQGLRDRVEKAQGDKSIEPDVLVKNFNYWLPSGQRGMSLDVWDASGAANSMPPEAELIRRPCFAGLDLGSNRDLLALVLYWPACGAWKTAAVRAWFWVAEDTIPIRLREDKVDYQPWVDSGEIETTPGEFTDQAAVRKKLEELAKVYTIRKLGADRKFGEKLLPELQQDGFDVYRIAQSFTNLCPAWQALERQVGRLELAHEGNTVLRWNAGNVVLARDPDGLVMPSKGKSKEKIDGIAALLNAEHLAMTTPYAGPTKPPESHALPKARGGGKRAILGAFG
jgi:phage terminase large subunit-like protein